jgi:addiction module HigA family antidote
MTKEFHVKGDSRMAPAHPGTILRADVLPALGLSVSEAARRMGVSRQTLHRVMAGTTGVTPDMALRLGKFCGNGPDIWLSLQGAYDLWHAKRRLANQLGRIATVRAAA